MRAALFTGVLLVLLVPLELRARFQGASYRSNALGMRDAEVSPGKPDGVLRIAFPGDSFTVGWGVEAEQGYADLIEDLLQY